MATLTECLPPWTSPEGFRALARDELSARYCTPLVPTRLSGTPRAFDLASEDATLIGFALAPSPRGSRRLTTLERAELSEAVMMLNMTPAQERVLVVGHDPARLAPWLAVYGSFVRDITLWTLRGPGRLERVDA